MNREPKKPTGECACPIRNCTHEKLPVFKYRSQAADVSRQRFAGRLYVQCPKHGRVDADQEFILENGKLWAEGHEPNDASATRPPDTSSPVRAAAESTAAAPVKPPMKSTSNQQAPPVPTPVKKDGGLFL